MNFTKGNFRLINSYMQKILQQKQLNQQEDMATITEADSFQKYINQKFQPEMPEQRP